MLPPKFLEEARQMTFLLRYLKMSVGGCVFTTDGNTPVTYCSVLSYPGRLHSEH